VTFDYVTALENAGALVYIIPCNTPNFDHYIEEFDGFLFPGGADIDPKLYHESVAGAQHFVTEIDTLLYEFMKKAIASKKKIL
jgi:gamma-glutamyl-gamma-aminobutyrate hydrolase PuuD